MTQGSGCKLDRSEDFPKRIYSRRYDMHGNGLVASSKRSKSWTVAGAPLVVTLSVVVILLTVQTVQALRTLTTFFFFFGVSR